MLRHIAISTISIFIHLAAIGQTNLVLNSGFELTYYPSIDSRELKKTGDLTTHWYNPIKKRSPHYFRAPNRSVAKASEGIGAVGLNLGGSNAKNPKVEYITGKLAQEMVKGQVYCISFKMLLHRSSKWAARNIGILLHHDKELITHTHDLVALKPSVQINETEPVVNTKWQEYNGHYIASGGEEYITFGVFGERKSVPLKDLGIKPYFQVDGFQNKAFYQLDEVAVVASFDTTDCGCAVPPAQVEDITQQNVGLQPYLFALDASGSMRKNNLFDSLRHNLVELLELLPLGTPISFATFATHSDLLFTGLRDENTPQIIDSLLSEVKLGGGTNVFEGLVEAANSIRTDGMDSARMVLVSDGNFIVSKRIETVVKNEFINEGRRLVVVNIESEAKHAEKLHPYQTSFIQVAPSELRNAIYHIYESKGVGSGAIACPCVNDYTEVMNYHFVIDYSGSMKLYKGRAMRVTKALFEKAPESSVISITAFSTSSQELYVGRKADITLAELDKLLRDYKAYGGTNPTPGVRHGLGVAERMAENRFSHLIVITDLNAENMNEIGFPEISRLAERIDLDASSVAVDLGSTADLMVSGRTQFDLTRGIFRDVSRTKFERDLFETVRSECDYTTQYYHYNPANDLLKKEAKNVVRSIFREFMEHGFGLSN